jgi:hypothetical protein
MRRGGQRFIGPGFLRSDGDPARVVDAIQQYLQAVARDEFVDCLARTFAVAVVVDDKDTARGEAGTEMRQFVLGRFVPAGISAQIQNQRRSLAGDGILDLAIVTMEPAGEISGRGEVYFTSSSVL